jgi:hypothetical protein
MTKTSSLLTFSSLMLSCMLALIPTATFAQSVGDFGNNGDNRNPFSRASGGDTSGLLQLINQAQLSGQRNSPEYAKGQQEQISSATEDFRTQQLQLLRQKSKKTTPVAPVQTSK